MLSLIPARASAAPARLWNGARRFAVNPLVWLAAVAIIFSALATWRQASADLARHMERAAMLGQIRIAAAAPGAPTAIITLERQHLLQNEVAGAAAERHVKLLRQGDGLWRIGNASTNRQLFLQFSDGVSHLASRQFLRGGEVIELAPREGQAAATVLAVSAGQLALEVRQWSAGRDRTERYEIRIRHGQLSEICRVDATRECRSASPYDPRPWLRSLLGRQGERDVLRLGGPALGMSSGVGIVPVADYGYNGIRVVMIAGRGFALAPGIDRLAEFRTAFGPRMRFIDILHDVNGWDRPRLTGLTAGRTRYAVSLEAGALSLRPADYPHRYRGEKGEALDKQNPAGDLATDLTMFQADSAERGQVTRVNLNTPPLDSFASSWTTALGFQALGRLSSLSIWQWAAFAVAIIALLTIVLMRALARRENALGGLVGIVLPAAPAATALLIAFSVMTAPEGAAPRDPLPAVIAWGAAAVSVLAMFRPLAACLFAAATVLVAIGSYALLAMGFSANELRWSRFHNETMLGVILGAGAISMAMAVPTVWFMRLAQWLARPGHLRWCPFPLGLVVVFALILMLGAAWIVFGSEGGIAGVMQPSETIKTLYVLIVAAIGVLILRRRFGGVSAPPAGAILLPLAASLVVLALILLLPVVSSDFSPFLILSLTLLCALPLILLFDGVARFACWLASPVRSEEAPPGPPDQRQPTARLDRPGLADKALRFFRRMLRWIAGASGFAWTGYILFPAIVAGVVMAVAWAGRNPAAAQLFVQESTPRFLEKLVPRVSSWLELGLGPAQVEGGAVSTLPLIEHPDVGQQVVRSRRAIAASGCRIPALELLPSHDDWRLTDAPAAMAAAAGSLLRWLNAAPQGCEGGAAAAQLTPVNHLAIPEIQNDFILPWAFTALGKDGAAALLMAQAAFCLLLLLTAFSIMRWSPDEEETSITASFYANATICFFFMLALQFAISWMNAFGLLPVMGQPMTYLSQGRSHFLFFGVAVIVVPLIGLRCLAPGGSRSSSSLPDPPWRWGKPPKRARIRADVVRGLVVAQSKR